MQILDKFWNKKGERKKERKKEKKKKDNLIWKNPSIQFQLLFFYFYFFILTSQLIVFTREKEVEDYTMSV